MAMETGRHSARGRATSDRGASGRTTFNWTAFAVGAVAAVVASRVLPPLLAQAAGTAAGGDPFDALARDHRNILALLDEIEGTRNDAVFRRTQLLLRLKRRLAAHALAEEDVVYPLLHDRAHEVEDTRHLYDEHADMKMRLFALEQMPKNDPRWLGLVSDLKTLIAGHARQEEEIDFPKLRATLDRQDKARLSGNVRREKALVL